MCVFSSFFKKLTHSVYIHIRKKTSSRQGRTHHIYKTQLLVTSTNSIKHCFYGRKTFLCTFLVTIFNVLYSVCKIWLPKSESPLSLTFLKNNNDRQNNIVIG